jgi:hypothetical protein
LSAPWRHLNALESGHDLLQSNWNPTTHYKTQKPEKSAEKDRNREEFYAWFFVRLRAMLSGWSIHSPQYIAARDILYSLAVYHSMTIMKVSGIPLIILKL